MMETVLALGQTTPFNLAESWAYDLTILNDAPLSAACFGLAAKIGEQFLDELPPLQINLSVIKTNKN